MYSVFQVESKFEVMVFVKVGKPSKQCREQPTNSTHSQKKEESTGLAYRAKSARALRHLTLISRKQVTYFSRVCCRSSSRSRSFSRILSHLGDFRYRLCFSVYSHLGDFRYRYQTNGLENRIRAKAEENERFHREPSLFQSWLMPSSDFLCCKVFLRIL